MQKIHLALASGTAIALASQALAGGVERSNQGIDFLFEEGTYAEFGIARIDPDVSGVQIQDNTPVGSVGANTGNMLGGENVSTLAYKQDLGESFVLGLKIDQPVGATIRYPTGTGHAFAGSVADLESKELTAYLLYKLGNGFSVIGGLRAQQVEGDVFLASGYDLETNNDLEFGYMVGVAYERPDIALRVSLTYNSAIDHNFDATESSPLTMGMDVEGDFDTTIPQSVNLSFQSGIAADTLLFGSIRWVDWSEFEINPDVYDDLIRFSSGGGDPANGFSYPLASYQSDSITYKLGVGRRFTDQWSGALTLTHEPDSGDIFGNLGPIDGRTSVGLGVTYTQDRFKISGGIEYSWLGDAKSQTPFGSPGEEISDFQDNTAVSYGIRIGYYF